MKDIKIEKDVPYEEIGNHIDKGPLIYKGTRYDFQSYYYGESKLGHGYVMIDYLGKFIDDEEDEDKIIIKGIIKDDYVDIDFSNDIPIIIPA